MNKTAVLILNYNGAKFLKDCFFSLTNQIISDFDTYLIDNGSSDDSLSYTRKNFPWVKIIKNKKNFGFALGYNIALKKIAPHYKYLILLNNDTIVHKNWLDELINTSEIDKKIGIATSVICNWKFKYIDCAGGKMLSFITGTNIGCFHKQKYNNLKTEKPLEVFYASGCSMLVKTWVFRKIGYLDKDYFAYWEDIDFSWRAHLAGIKIVCAPKSILAHFGSGTSQGKPDAYFLAEKNRLTTYFKNLSLPIFLVIIGPLIIVRLILALTFFQSIDYFNAKMKGILSIFANTFSLWEKRTNVQNTRRISDWEILKLNSKVEK